MSFKGDGMRNKNSHYRRPSLKNELKLLPGYIPITLWVLFTFVLIGWIMAASFSTTKDIFQGKALPQRPAL